MAEAWQNQLGAWAASLRHAGDQVSDRLNAEESGRHILVAALRFSRYRELRLTVVAPARSLAFRIWCRNGSTWAPSPDVGFRVYPHQLPALAEAVAKALEQFAASDNDEQGLPLVQVQAALMSRTTANR